MSKVPMLAPVAEPHPDLNAAVDQARKTIDVLARAGFNEASFRDGSYFKANETESGGLLATGGMLVHQRTHTTTVIVRNDGSSAIDAMNEVAEMGHTQKAIGAMSDGRSQSWVSTQQAAIARDAN